MTRLAALRSWYSAERGGFITLENDVLGIVSQVRELYEDRVTVELDDQTGFFHFVEHSDGTDRLIFTVEQLDQRALDRLILADSQNRYHQDPYDAAEREQDELNAQIEARQREQITEMGEELVFHLQKEGKAPFLPQPVYMTKGLPDADS